MDLHLALIMDESPPIIIETGIDVEKSLHEAWERSNILNFEPDENDYGCKC